MPTCLFSGCERLASGQGYCNSHYHKMRREGVIQKRRVMNDHLARFHAKYTVNAVTGCWEWTGYIHPSGYGVIGIWEEGRSVRAHRFSYSNFVGPIPPGMLVCHECDNRKCVNPDHLFLGDGKVNIQDCVRKGRHASTKLTNIPRVTWPMATNIRVLYARGEHSILDIARIYLL